MVTTIKNPTTGEVLPQFTMYRYDQLNRLKNMKAFADFDFKSNEWNYSGYDGRYFNEFTYDGNGNIETQLRMDEAGNAINNLTYQRLRTPQGLKQNRLYHINDAIDAQAFEDDIDDQGDFNGDASTINTANNYAYDELGNLTRNTQKEIAEIKWTVYGKVQEVVRTQGSSKKNLKFEYNATGQRTAKHVYNNAWKREYSDYYVYDAQGNMMSIYRLSVDEQQQTAAYTLTERPMYGSSRLGVDKATLEFMGYTPPTNGLTNHVLGLKQYEGSNHLGNVLTTFSDKKIPVDENNNGTIAYYNADVTSSTDYYPFGVTMKGRDFNSSTSRFGFNSMEKIEETETMDFGARLLDGDLGVWLALDPLMAKYPDLSPYCFVANSPIVFVDPDGRKIVCTSKEGQEKLLRIMVEAFGDEGYNFCFNSNNELIYTGGTYNKYLNLKFYSGFTDEELKVAIPLLSVMNSNEVVTVIFKRDMLTKEKGGEYAATKYDRNKEEKIVIDPDENPILVNYIKIDSENPDRTLILMNRNNQVIIRSKDIVVHSVDTDNSLYRRFFHGLGHIIYQKNSQQPNVIEYENKAKSVKKEEWTFSLSPESEYSANPEEPTRMDPSHEAKPD